MTAPARTLVMGVLNVTPDSFSDGGRWLARDAAIARGRHLIADGADLLDVGGESTRPGSARVDAATECDRIIGVIEALAAEGITISVDTQNAITAAAALAAGANIVNDISGGADPHMYRLIARAGVPYVIQHSRGDGATMNALATYHNVVEEVLAELSERVEAALAAGVAESQVIVDPGLGFAKQAEHDWALLANLDRFTALGFPVLVGASRKRFLAGVVPAELSGSATERDFATSAVSALAACSGVWAVRVHEARASRDAVRVAAAVRGAK